MYRAICLVQCQAYKRGHDHSGPAPVTPLERARQHTKWREKRTNCARHIKDKSSVPSARVSLTSGLAMDPDPAELRAKMETSACVTGNPFLAAAL